MSDSITPVLLPVEGAAGFLGLSERSWCPLARNADLEAAVKLGFEDQLWAAADVQRTQIVLTGHKQLAFRPSGFGRCGHHQPSTSGSHPELLL